MPFFTCRKKYRRAIGRVMEHPVTEISIIILVFGYLLLIFSVLIAGDELDQKTLDDINIAGRQ
jgi:hypothetical protein